MPEAQPIPENVPVIAPSVTHNETGVDTEFADWFATLGRHYNWPAVRGREICAIALLIVVFDLLVYRGHGFSGYAALFLLTPTLLAIAAPKPRTALALWIVVGMMLLLALKLFWAGSWALVTAGFLLVIAFAMALAGHSPHALGLFAFAGQSPLASLLALGEYRNACQQFSPNIRRTAWMQILLPLAAVLCFGTLFILANPDVVTAVTNSMNRLATALGEFFSAFSPGVAEVCLWFVVAICSVGMLRPFYRLARSASEMTTEGKAAADIPKLVAEAPLYGAYRNTLVSLIILFALYLVFEFATLWFREFEEGFYYSGYAHEGAAWLTVALAMATVVLSLIFRGKVLHDPRLPALRKLAWFWSAGNVLLAIAVFNRMHIYVGFNGMTRMRVVGLLGISAVVAGFVLVVWKIVRQRGFLWLIQRQLWALAIAVYLLMVVPVDAVVHSYNVQRILNGDPAPVVQISVHPISSDGLAVITPLLKSDNEIIREGVRAILAERAVELEQELEKRRQLGWTAYQGAEAFLQEELNLFHAEWKPFAVDKPKRAAARKTFDEYAYQWF